MKQIRPELGLHVAKDEVQQSYAEQQCMQVVNQWDEFWLATIKNAPRRLKNFKLGRTHASKVSEERKEERWERALWCTWGPEIGNRRDEMLPGICHSIVSYQVPLKAPKADDNRKNRGWGRIDLVGRTAANIPVLMELKRFDAANEFPLRAILEVIAYGAGFRLAWEAPSSRLKNEWAQATDKPVPTFDRLPLVVLGTEGYRTGWADAFRQIKEPLKQLTPKIEAAGFDLHFCEMMCYGAPFEP